jgi:hypothetical protein
MTHESWFYNCTAGPAKELEGRSDSSEEGLTFESDRDESMACAEEEEELSPSGAYDESPQPGWEYEYDSSVDSEAPPHRRPPPEPDEEPEGYGIGSDYETDDEEYNEAPKNAEHFDADGGESDNEEPLVYLVGGQLQFNVADGDTFDGAMERLWESLKKVYPDVTNDNRSEWEFWLNAVVYRTMNIPERYRKLPWERSLAELTWARATAGQGISMSAAKKLHATMKKLGRSAEGAPTLADLLPEDYSTIRDAFRDHQGINIREVNAEPRFTKDGKGVLPLV